MNGRKVMNVNWYFHSSFILPHSSLEISLSQQSQRLEPGFDLADAGANVADHGVAGGVTCVERAGVGRGERGGADDRRGAIEAELLRRRRKNAQLFVRVGRIDDQEVGPAGDSH